MKIIKITFEAFDAKEKEAKINYLKDMYKLLGNNLYQVQIGDDIFYDRESLQLWQIEKKL
jgi:hypothetical protein